MRQLEHHEVDRPGRRYPIWVVCPDWDDPRNVGSAFRLADAAGLAGLVLAGSTPTPPNARIAKTARATVRSVPWRKVLSAVDFLTEAKKKGGRLLALELTDASVSLLDKKELPTEEIFLVCGNEARGVPQALLDLCEGAVHLPMQGQNTSMNVSVALGAAVYLMIDRLS